MAWGNWEDSKLGGIKLVANDCDKQQCIITINDVGYEEGYIHALSSWLTNMDINEVI